MRGNASKDDPDLAEYWQKRALKKLPEIEPKRLLSLAAKQKGLCPRCGLDLVEGAGYDPDDVRGWAEWFTAKLRLIHTHHITYRSKGGSDHPSNLVVLHTECHRQHHAGDHRQRAAE